jgi:outer membrane phospholipase A
MQGIIRTLLLLGASLGAAQALAAEPASPRPPGSFERSPIHLVLEQEQALSRDEPMYFVVGAAADTEHDVIARFQLSFKYRIFDPGGFLGRELTPARNLYFGYTQTSLWNWSAESAPFEDTTYRPSLFWQDVSSGRGLVPDAWRFGFEHASNGQAEERSRSVNMAFLRPVWWTELGGRELVVAPKFIAYLAKSDNPDIGDYYGHAEWLLRYGSETSWLLESRLRGTSARRGSIELNLSYPVRAALFYRAGGFIYLQYFQGYGESLLDYNRRAEPTLRLGLAIVR